jgi:uncharacterized protein (TIGR03437 family)
MPGDTSFRKTLFSMRLIIALFISTLTIAIAAPPNRVAVKVDDGRRVFLNGHVPPKAQPQYDQGRVSASLALTHLTLHFKPSAAQQADLDQLLSDQQNPSSPAYHHWLTPEEYGARFGLSDADLAQATAWLQSQGLTVTATARARNYVSFDGTAGTIERAFRTELHNYLVDGESHFANATDPSVPEALEPVVRGIRGLNDFRYRPRLRMRELVPHDTSQTGHHYLAPDDFAIIYNLKPLYAAGFDGTGQKLVVVGQTALHLADLQQFRTLFNLPAQDPQVVLVPGSRDPGVRMADLQEADLDLEWSGAVARNATIIYVYSPDVIESISYAIDQNLAPVVSMSYGSCEPSNLASDAASMRTMAQQANSQGITWFNASGDNGGADCAGQSASDGRLSVDLPASVPEVTGVGGTEFNEGSGSYWNTTNDANSASVLSYIPEMAWNDSAIDGSPSASGGGASIYFTKPSWQTGPGVPSDGARDVPDISLNASADHDGYDTTMSGKLYSTGGTSAPTPMFAGIAAILNQYLVKGGVQAAPGLGNINPKLYSLAQSSPGAFHDITSGDNIVTPSCPRRGCTTPPVPVGYSTGVGYDQVTGLGSVDVNALFQAWSGGGTSQLTPRVMLSASSTALASGDTTVLTATVTSPNGNTPTGTITFLLGAASLGTSTLAGSGGTATAMLTVAASQLPTGSNNITAQYNSDNGAFSSAAASVTVTVGSSAVGLTITGVADGASFQHAYAPGEVLSIFGANLAGGMQTASAVPLTTSMGGVSVTIHGVPAPLYMVSPGQLNVQIPYETPLNGPSTVLVQYNGQVASYTLNLNATAPAIFTGQGGAPVPNGSAKAGDIITLFVTGAGALSPGVATGDGPPAGTPIANLPKPVNQPVAVTVGGIGAGITFAGVPSGLVGVMQINYQVPGGLSAGVHPVVVTIGGASSAEANLTITQ